MTLSNTAKHQVAQAIRSEVITRIFESDAYTELLQDMIPSLVNDLLGDVEEDLKFELSMILFDSIELKWITLGRVKPPFLGVNLFYKFPMETQTYKVEFTIKCNGNPRKWVAEAIGECIDFNEGEDILDWDVTIVE